jgi:hypothetical protein
VFIFLQRKPINNGYNIEERCSGIGLGTFFMHALMITLGVMIITLGVLIISFGVINGLMFEGL